MLVSPVILWTLMFLFWFWHMLLPIILGNLILFVADVIAIGYFLTCICLAGVVAMLFCYMIDGDVNTIKLMLYPVFCIGRCYCYLFL